MTTEADATEPQPERRRVEAVIAAMEAGAEGIKRREVEQAVTALEARGDLTPAQRDAVEAMADDIVEGLLTAPKRSLRAAAGDGERAAIETAIRVFDPDLGEVSDDE